MIRARIGETVFVYVIPLATSSSGAPWWFAGTVGVAGVLAGLLIKWRIDAASTRERDEREDRLRFIQDKRVAYADLLAACTEVADAEHDHRLLRARGRRLDADPASTDDDVDDYNAAVETVENRRTPGYQAVTRAHAVVEMLGPEPVVQAADILVSRCHHPHLLESRIDAERAYVDAVRADLGYSSTSHLPFTVFEDYVEYDDPRSGIDTSEWTPPRA